MLLIESTVIGEQISAELRLPPSHLKLCYIVHLLLQPSPSSWFLSSHSFDLRAPSPHDSTQSPSSLT